MGRLLRLLTVLRVGFTYPALNTLPSCEHGSAHVHRNNEVDEVGDGLRLHLSPKVISEVLAWAGGPYRHLLVARHP